MAKTVYLIAITLLLVSCTHNDTGESGATDRSSATNNTIGENSNTSDVEGNAESLNSAPTHYYDEREGDRYLYIGAVSDEDKKRGRAVGDVVQYRFLGIEDGMTTLERVTDDGGSLGLLQCASPCRVMKATSGNAVSRLPFDTASIAGAAMADAMSGQLLPVKKINGATEELSSILPERFLGKWNINVFDCFSEDVSTTLVVTPGELQFHEATATIKTVALRGRSATVTTDVSGDDNGAPQPFIYMLLLNGKGDQLDVSGVVRSKCPPSG